MKLGTLVVATVMSMGFSTAAMAQGGTEITVGLGALSLISSDGESAFVINVNQQVVRLGLPLTNKVMLEPALTLDYVSSEGTSATDLGVGAFVPFYLGESTSRGVYLAPGAFINYSSFNGDFIDESSSQVSVAFEVGNKSRISDAVALRLAAQVGIALENDDNDQFTAIRGIIGLSVKLK
jgi:hypothetical protein